MATALNIVKGFFPKVQTVIDAKFPLKIEVTEKDSTSEGNKKHDSCAMALACKRKFKLDGVVISRTMAYLVKGKMARRFRLSMSIQKEIVAFDRGTNFAPGTYLLGTVGNHAKLLGKRRGSDNYPRKKSVKTGNKRFRHLTTNIRSVLGIKE